MKKIYMTNSLSGHKELFIPIDENNVRMFVCGPTVYGPMHIGHAKTYIAYDFMARIIKTIYPSFTYVQNITDVDDKIINRAIEEGKTVTDVANYWESRYYSNMVTLGNNQVDYYHRAHENIDQIIHQINILLSKNYAYTISNDGVYIDSFAIGSNGVFNGRKKHSSEYSRINNDGKRSPSDFVLWKFTNNDTPIGWNASFGYGRPGWHIEDTAISEKYLGDHYDIHGGAIDLVFPHHEAEVLIMEAITGNKLSNYWPHGGLLTVDGVKMGKSLNNFITVDDVLGEWDSNVIRFFVLSKNYSSNADWTKNSLIQSKRSIEKIENYYQNHSPKKLNNDDEIYSSIMEILYDDFNSSEALAIIFKAINEKNISQHVLDKVNNIYQTFNFSFLVKAPNDVEEIAQKRLVYRRLGDWGTSDELRREIESLGWHVRDGKDSYQLERIK